MVLYELWSHRHRSCRVIGVCRTWSCGKHARLRRDHNADDENETTRERDRSIKISGEENTMACMALAGERMESQESATATPCGSGQCCQAAWPQAG
jgi:hypothetical protein